MSKGASSCRANIASATSVSISAISGDRPASLLAWPRHGISVGVGGCFLSCEIDASPLVILITPVGVISTPQTCNPGTSDTVDGRHNVSRREARFAAHFLI